MEIRGDLCTLSLMPHRIYGKGIHCIIFLLNCYLWYCCIPGGECGGDASP
jgi:hypothetical protein